MNRFLRTLLAAAFVFTTAALHASGNLKVTLSPSGAVMTGAQWRVDNGAWQNSGTTVKGLGAGSHIVGFKPVNGWIAPTNATTTISNGTTTALTATYIQAASVTVTLTPSSAQWKLDGGAWNFNGATLGNLTPGTHSISYSTLSGYQTPAPENVTLSAGQNTALQRTYVQSAQILISLVPNSGQWRANGGPWQPSGSSLFVAPGTYTIDYSSITLYDSPPAETITVAAGGVFSTTRSYTSQLPTLEIDLAPNTGQWRIDGGAWQPSGTTLTGLSAGTHTVDYFDIGGDYAPLNSESVTLNLRDHIVLSRSYPFSPGAVAVTLAPSFGQWNIDGGAWQASGTTASAVPTGNHSISYSAIADYDAPPTEVVQVLPNQTVSLSRAYTPHPASVTVTLSPAGGQWRLQGGTWQASGATLAGLTPGTYPVEYSTLADYSAPAAESVTLAAGQNLSLTRNYVQLAIASVALNPASGQWRIDGGAWQPSGAVIHNLSVGAHPIDYIPVAGYVTLASETVTLTAGTNPTFTRTYARLPQLTVTLAPNTGQWRIDGGAWQPSGATLTDLTVGDHLVEASDIPNYTTPAGETVTLAGGDTDALSLTYTAHPAQLTIATTPSSGQWSAYLDGTAPTSTWNPSGTTISLAPGQYHLGYSAVAGYDTPTLNSVVLNAGDVVSLAAQYTAHPAQISVLLDNSGGQWRVDGGAWQPAGTSASLAPGNHTLDFAAVPGFTTPSPKAIVVDPGDDVKFAFRYIPLPPAMVIYTTPSDAKWRVDGGAWNDSGAGVGNLAPGPHHVEFTPLVGGYNTELDTTLWVYPDQVARYNWTLDRQFAGFDVTLNPSTGGYKAGGFTNWLNSGSSIWGHAGEPMLFQYEPIAGLPTPHSEYLHSDVPQQSIAVNRSYVATSGATVSLGLDQPNGSWRIYSGLSPDAPWNQGSATVTGLVPGTYTIEYSAIFGFGSPSSETVALADGQDVVLSRTYTQFPGQVSVTTNPVSSYWMLGPANSSPTYTNYAYGETATNVAPGDYSVAYGWVQDYTTPWPDTITVHSGEDVYITKTYDHVFDITLSLDPYTARWRMDGGDWVQSGKGVWGVANGDHLIEYEPADGYVTPPAETITYSGQQLQLYRQYKALAKLTVSLDPYQAQWRIDGGAWQASDTTVANLSFDVPHTIDYAPYDGYVTPASETITLAAGDNQQLFRAYVQLAQLTINLNPANASFRIDGGSWQSAGATVTGIVPGDHTIEYDPAPGYTGPPTETITLSSGSNQVLWRSCTGDPQLVIYLYPYTGFWRMDGGPWIVNGGGIAGMADGSQHLIEYAPLDGYTAPAAETVTVQSGAITSFYRTYTANSP